MINREKEAEEGWGMLNATFMIMFAWVVLWLFKADINPAVLIVPLWCGVYKIMRRRYKLEVKFINIKRFNDSTERERLENSHS